MMGMNIADSEVGSGVRGFEFSVNSTEQNALTFMKFQKIFGCDRGSYQTQLGSKEQDARVPADQRGTIPVHIELNASALPLVQSVGRS